MTFSGTHVRTVRTGSYAPGVDLKVAGFLAPYQRFMRTLLHHLFLIYFKLINSFNPDSCDSGKSQKHPYICL